jgi:predicted amidophosphoribosyltransferase
VGRPPPRAVLVDDVMTTGSTIAACARELRRGGAERVVAVTFARAEHLA